MNLFTRQVPFYVGHGGIEKWCGMSVLPRRALFGYACAKRKIMRCEALAASAQERQHPHACCDINAAMTNGRWSW